MGLQSFLKMRSKAGIVLVMLRAIEDIYSVAHSSEIKKTPFYWSFVAGSGVEPETFGL